MTLAYSFLLTFVNTSGPFWHMAALFFFSNAALLLVHITSTSSKNLKSRINKRTKMYISPPPRGNSLAGNTRSPTGLGLLSLVKSNKAHSRLMECIARCWWGRRKWARVTELQPPQTLDRRIKQTLDVYQFLVQIMLRAVNLQGRGETSPAEPV